VIRDIFLGVVSKTEVTLFDVFDVASSSIFGRMFVGNVSYVAYMFIIGSILLWFHPYGSFLQTGGCLYFLYLIYPEMGGFEGAFSGSLQLGMGFIIGALASVIGLCSLFKQRFMGFRKKGRIHYVNFNDYR